MAKAPHTLRLGTRRSLLAMAQSAAVARELTAAHPELHVELVGIDTRGDQIQDVPLSKIEGKEFFVAELDTALKAGAVDFCVHSLKDLSLERPREFAPLIIPKRENQRDVIIFSPKVSAAPHSVGVLRVGTSAPRRLTNLPEFLEQAYPASPEGKRPKIEFVQIRGNVNTRLSKLHLDGPDGVDCCVLALAGLHRLLADDVGAGQKQAAAPEILKLLKGTRCMVLPLSVQPSSPGQGALALECRADDAATLKYLSALHHKPTAHDVARERAVLKEWGGGCHLKLGASTLRLPHLDQVTFVRGCHPNGTTVREVRWASPEALPRHVHSDETYLSSSERLVHEESLASSDKLTKASTYTAWFLAHSRALPKEWVPQTESRMVFTAGVPSWFRVAALGVWVSACAEGLGIEHFVEWAVASPLLQQQAPAMVNLTHQGAVIEERLFNKLEGKNNAKSYAHLATYQITPAKVSFELQERLKRVRHFYWTSISQFEQVTQYLPSQKDNPGVTHSSGPGKTAEYLIDRGIDLMVFPSAEEWKTWLTQK